MFFSASEMVVTRSFPLGSLVREKKLTAQYLPHLNSWLPECVQLRSVTFQVNKFANLFNSPMVKREEAINATILAKIIVDSARE